MQLLEKKEIFFSSVETHMLTHTHMCSPFFFSTASHILTNAGS